MLFIVSIAVVLLACVACNDLAPLGEGEHCNPNRNPPPADQECKDGLACTVPDNCARVASVSRLMSSSDRSFDGAMVNSLVLPIIRRQHGSSRAAKRMPELSGLSRQGRTRWPPSKVGAQRLGLT